MFLVHGNQVDHRILLPLDPVLRAADGWQRMYLDLPGFGSTPALVDGSAQELADWLLELVDEISAGGPFALVANSFGGLLARYVASRRPDRVAGMALLAPVVEPDHALRRLPPPRTAIRDDVLLDSLSRDDRAEYKEVAVLQTRENWERFRAAALPGLRSYDRAANARLAASYRLDAVPEDFGTTSAPVLVVAARDDAVVGWEDQRDLAASYPAATLAVLADAGHNVHLDRPAVVGALLADWLSRMHAG